MSRFGVLLLLAVSLVPATACTKVSELFSSSTATPAAPAWPPTAGSTIVYTAIGASDASGVGASVPCIPFTDCPSGTGYVGVTTRSLTSSGYKVSLNNLGIPTAVIGPDFQKLGQQYGRTIAGNFLESEMPFVPSNTTLVTIFAGGNDVNTITAALGAGAGASNQTAYIDTQVKAFGADYTALLDGIRQKAGVHIVILNLPNLAGLPYLASASTAQRQAAQRAAVGMTTTVINPLVSSTITVVDLMCDARAYQASNYSSDGFHPNDAGYAFIAGEIVKAATTTGYAAPKSSCAQMTLVP